MNRRGLFEEAGRTGSPMVAVVGARRAGAARGRRGGGRGGRRAVLAGSGTAAAAKERSPPASALRRAGRLRRPGRGRSRWHLWWPRPPWWCCPPAPTDATWRHGWPTCSAARCWPAPPRSATTVPCWCAGAAWCPRSTASTGGGGHPGPRVPRRPGARRGRLEAVVEGAATRAATSATGGWEKVGPPASTSRGRRRGDIGRVAPGTPTTGRGRGRAAGPEHRRPGRRPPHRGRRRRPGRARAVRAAGTGGHRPGSAFGATASGVRRRLGAARPLDRHHGRGRRPRPVRGARHLRGGAARHGAGPARHVVAVNTDASAPMMALADLAIVTDARALLTELAGRLGVADGPVRAWLAT